LCSWLRVAGPDSNALRLLLLAELVSAAGFERDRLYIEWQLHFDPEQWILQHSEQEVVQPGLIQVGLCMIRVLVTVQLQRQHRCW
jgi:hypothetical protein